MKKILAIVLTVVLILGLCACGQTGGTEDTKAGETTAATEQTTEATENDGKVKYTATVVDEGGNPLAGVMVQICKDSCMPAITDANGVATWNVAEDDYKVSFVDGLPEGYEYSTEETEFYFADGAYELTITLKAVA